MHKKVAYLFLPNSLMLAKCFSAETRLEYRSSYWTMEMQVVE